MTAAAYPQAEYVALRTILVNGVPGYHAGDPVYASALERLGVSEEDGDVALADSNEAQALARAQAKVTGDSNVPQLDQLRAARDEEGVVEPGSVGAFDPSRHTVADVNAYLADQSDAEKARVIEAERSSQGRQGIVDGPHAKAAASAPAVSAPVRGEIAEA
jgi:hypothetical protein